MMKFKDIGNGQPVILLHGFLENSKMWNEFAEELSKEYRVISPDLYGHGDTASIDEKHTMEIQAKGVIEVLDHLGISSAGFIGHSMGGYISLAIARDYADKVEKLGLFFSSTLPDSEEKKEQRLKAAETAEKDKDNFVRIGVKNLFDQNNLSNLREEIEIARSWAYEMPLDGVTSALKGMRERADTTEVLEKADYPIQIILGEFDGAINLEEFKKVIPNKENIKLDVLPIGHMGHLEAPKESLEILKSFLKR